MLMEHTLAPQCEAMLRVVRVWVREDVSLEVNTEEAETVLLMDEPESDVHGMVVVFEADVASVLGRMVQSHSS